MSDLIVEAPSAVAESAELDGVLTAIARRCADTSDTRSAVAMSVGVVAVALLRHPDVVPDSWMAQPTMRRSVASTVKLLHPHAVSRALIPSILPALATRLADRVAEELRTGGALGSVETAELAAQVVDEILGALR